MKNRWSSEELLGRVEADLLFEKQHWLLLVCTVLVGCVGLNLNAIPMILGAKLLSPLMPAIVGLAVGASFVDFSLVKRSLRILLLQIVAALLLATLYFWWTPLQAAGVELQGQTSSTLWNVLIAFIGGLVGAVGLRRKEVHHLAAGVALATSLVPPLCAAGYGIAHADMTFVLGALYLFAINVFFILLAHYLVSYLVGDAERKSLNEVLVATLLLSVSLLLTFPAKTAADKLVFEEQLRVFVAQEFSQYAIVSQTYDAQKQELRLRIAGRELSSFELLAIEGHKDDYGLERVQLVVEQMLTTVAVKEDES